MTRFARAEGSKSSNKRVPEDATPWQKLKYGESESTASGDPSKKSQTKKIHWKKNNGAACDEELRDKSAQEYLKHKKEYKRRKPMSNYPSFVKDGREVIIVRFEGFPVRREDAEKLKEIKKKLLSSKIPHIEIKKRMKLERRRAEKALARDKKVVCFHCRQSGHMLSQCPNLKNEDQGPESEICFKCGSTEHQHTQCKVYKGDNYKFATCFICQQKGHISKQCPDNPRGLYPNGGSCRICGDVTHMKKDCSKFSKKKKKDFEVTVDILNSRTLESIDDGLKKKKMSPPPVKAKKIIRM